MPSTQHDALAEAMAAAPPVSGGSVEEARAGMEAMTAESPMPDGASVASVEAGGVPALDIRKGGRDSRALRHR